jgi:hypothetical protein
MNITTDGVTTLVKLDNPVVHVTAYDGFNVVSWEPVRDAALYYVWRVDTQSSSQVNVGVNISSISNLTLIDNVAQSTSPASEKLVNGRTYKYIVIAYPSINRYLNDGTGSGNTTGFTDAHNDLYSGRGEATVTAKVPDPATYKVPKATDIKYQLDPISGTIRISWTQPANATAQIRYFPGGYPADAALDFAGFNTLTTTSLFSATGPGYLYPKNAVSASFPVIGGKATIAIQTSYYPGLSAGTTVYASDRPATQNITLDQYNLDLDWQNTTPPNNFTATHIYKTATTGTVQLAWSRILGDDDVYSSTTYSTTASNKVTYNVYKREIPVNEDLSSGLLVGAGDWVKVNYTFQDRGDGDASNTIYAVETGDVDSTLSGWYYIVYASASRSGKTSHSYPLYAYLARTLPDEAEIATSTGVAYGGITASDGHPYTIRIDVTGLAAGVSYKLYRGELIPILIERIATGNDTWVDPDDLTYQFTSYDPTPVATWTGVQSTGDTTGAIYDSGIEPRKSYMYKLVSSSIAENNTETLLGDGSTYEFKPTTTGQAASVYSYLTLSITTPSSIASGDNANDNQRGLINAAVTNSGYTKGLDVKLFYRRETTTVPPNATTTDWTYLATLEKNTQTGGDSTQITDESGVFKAKDYQIPNVAFGETYHFKAIAYLDNITREIPNINSATIAGSAITEAKTTTAITPSQPSLSSLAAASVTLNTGAQTVSNINGNFVNGVSINLRIVRSGTPVVGDDSEQTYYEQPGEFTITRQTGLTSYQFQFALTEIPPVSSPTVNYTIQYKYPWEKWETAPARQIGGSIPH